MWGKFIDGYKGNVLQNICKEHLKLKKLFIKKKKKKNSKAQISTSINKMYGYLLLRQKYQNLKTEHERKALLADLMVQGEGKERRIGPDISARVYRNLTVQNPQLVLDWCCHETDGRHHWLLRCYCFQVKTVPLSIMWTFYWRKVNCVDYRKNFNI